MAPIRAGAYSWARRVVLLCLLLLVGAAGGRPELTRLQVAGRDALQAADSRVEKIGYVKARVLRVNSAACAALS